MRLILLLLGVQTDTAETLLARHRAQTAAEVRCRVSDDPDEIVVCGGRDADRYRVPLLIATPGDPKAVDALGERERLLVVPPLPCGVGAFVVNCGSVGVTASTRTGITTGGQRPLAR